METDGGGWTVLQRRQDGSADFYRGWVDYEMGFGKLDNEFWLGLSKIHRLTKIDSSLRVDLEDFNQNTRYAHYDTFSVGDVSAEYVLTVGGYSGTAGDSLGGVSGMKFSTKDNDNDVSSSHCAQRYQGAWWFGACHHSHLNGQYLGGFHNRNAHGVQWRHWTGTYYSLRFSEMKLRESYPPSLYEQYCCNADNVGEIIKVAYNGRESFIICPDTLPLSCYRILDGNFSSCSDVLTQYPDAVSGYYNIELNNGSIASVYCDMEGDNCDGEGGWMRVANVNMTLPDATCPNGLMLYDLDGLRACSSDGSYRSCPSTKFPSYQYSYSKVCGQVRGYKYGGTHAFDGALNHGANLDSQYVTGVSITYDSSPRKHIWTYAGGTRESGISGSGDSLCTCNTLSRFSPPSFVGNNFYCESSSTGYNDILWDGQQCNGDEPLCCTAPNMPWFTTTLNDATTSDIEVRLCTWHGGSHTPFDIMQLYIK